CSHLGTRSVPTAFLRRGYRDLDEPLHLRRPRFREIFVELVQVFPLQLPRPGCCRQFRCCTGPAQHAVGGRFNVELQPVTAVAHAEDRKSGEEGLNVYITTWDGSSK